MIQETYIAKTCTIRSLNCGTTIYDSSGRHPPRAALIFRKGIEATPLTQFITADLAEVQMGGNCIRTVFASGYHDATKTVVSRELHKLVEFCKSKGYELISGCDSIALNEFWDSRNTDKRGKELLEYLIYKNIYLPSFYTT